ncbi:MAG: 4-hydroxy-tetrahydrodipicolinate synthase [Bacteroidota bacterium]|nr:4-hydroxy-tetrahydrodipicolinate synthase [Bacteroidota bacterium]MDX5430376.1 4-hydroxy-tetrahydrodipicolinate synthase [Bacteroidota bacterium]MDX5469137.1 4-hydroxy-tetrahydrodipicolinate synthase [Bacteroidota bacterium]
MINLYGTGVAMVTPFNSDGSVDYPALKKLTRHLIDNKVEYLVVMGTTGESATLSKEEKRQIFDTVLEENGGAVPVIAGMGGNNTNELTQSLQDFNFDGISAVLSVSPYYNKPNQMGIRAHYTAVADASPLPVILYNVPGRTGSNMTAETTLSLAEHQNIVAMKEASGNFEQCMEILRHRPKDFFVLSGDDALTLAFLSLGMDGVISVIANAYPRNFSELVRMGIGGNFKAARELHYPLLGMMNEIFADGSPGGIKEILNHLGICGTHVRLPLANVNAKVQANLLAMAKEYGK